MLAERQLRHDKTIGIEQGIERKESKKAKKKGGKSHNNQKAFCLKFMVIGFALFSYAALRW